MKPSKLAAKWEAKLRAEGLAHLDHDDGCDIIVGNKGSGKLHPDESADGQLENRRAAEAQIDRRRDILRTHRFRRARDRRIWALYAEGFGTREIRRRLHHDRQTVRASIAATEAAVAKKGNRHASIESLINRSSPKFLAALFRALRGGAGRR